MKKFLKKLFLILFFTVFLTFFSKNAYAACTSAPILSPGSSTTGASSITWTLSLKNTCAASTTYNITHSSMPAGWSYSVSATPITISAGATKTFTVTITRPLNYPLGIYRYTITATNSTVTSLKDSVILEYKVCQSCADMGYECSSFNASCGSGEPTIPTTCGNGGNCTNSTYTCNTSTRKCIPPATCTYTYSAWSACVGGTQTRTVLTTSPTGCVGTPITSQSCTAPTCTYTYSAWSACVGGTQTRTVLTTSPTDCVGTPITSQGCTIDCVYSYSAWSDCAGGTQTRTVEGVTPPDCTGGTPLISRSCTVPCEYTYTGWGSCTPGGSQTRSVLTTSPDGCTGSPIVTRECIAPLINCDPDNKYQDYADISPVGIPFGGICALNQGISTFLNILIALSIVLTIIFLIWGGITWITSEGDKQKLNQARNRLTFAIIGLIIVFISFLIIRFIGVFFNITTIN